MKRGVDGDLRSTLTLLSQDRQTRRGKRKMKDMKSVSGLQLSAAAGY